MDRSGGIPSQLAGTAAALCLAAVACSGGSTMRKAAPGAGGAVGAGGSPAAGAGGASAGGGLIGSGGTPVSVDGGSGATAGDSGICGSTEVGEVETVEVQVPGNVLVVFDASKSMAEDWTTATGPKPKWQAAGEALVAAVDPVKDQLNVGVIFFPTIAGTVLLCSSNVHDLATPQQIDWIPGSGFQTAWDAWWAAYGLKLGTPLNRAFDRADAALQSMTLPGDTAVVLFTDGEPICMDGVPASQRAAQWASQGIRTYVVGLPGASVASALLADIATQGGTGPTYLEPADAAQLEQELAKIAKTTITTETKIDSCEIPLDPPPPNPDDVHVVVVDGGVEYEVPRDDPDGWDLSSDGKTATLRGKACDDALAGRFSSARVEFGCVDLPPLPK